MVRWTAPAVVVLGAACSDAQQSPSSAPPAPENRSGDGSTGQPSPEDRSADDLGAAGEVLRSIDRSVLLLIGEDAARASTASGIPTDDRGLIGRNQQWGEMYSARFQLGAGLALRMSLALDDLPRATSAWLAIEAGVSSIEESGRLPSSAPDEVLMGRVPSEADVASGAAFFLGDACAAVLALSTFGDAESVASTERRDAVVEKLGRAVAWLMTQREQLERVDARAPNRLFHDATAYQACGELVDNSAAKELATVFADLARVQYDSAGFFVERNGSDTNYQAVNVVQAIELILAGHRTHETELRVQIAEATEWMATKTDSTGAVDSSDNTRSCGGCEVFLPGDPPKQLGPTVWLRGLSYGAVFEDRESVRNAVPRFIRWVESDPSTSCYGRDSTGALQPQDPSTLCS